MKRRVDDAVEELRDETNKTFERAFARLEALERGIVGTPDAPGMVGQLSTMKVDMDHKFANVASLLRINNWLTGLVIAVLVAGAIRVLVGV